jgi:hypothetical protein
MNNTVILFYFFRSSRQRVSLGEDGARYCTLLYWFGLYYCTVMHCTVLCCAILYCTVLFCNLVGKSQKGIFL